LPPVQEDPQPCGNVLVAQDTGNGSLVGVSGDAGGEFLGEVADSPTPVLHSDRVRVMLVLGLGHEGESVSLNDASQIHAHRCYALHRNDHLSSLPLSLSGFNPRLGCRQKTGPFWLIARKDPLERWRQGSSARTIRRPRSGDPLAPVPPTAPAVPPAPVLSGPQCRPRAARERERSRHTPSAPGRSGEPPRGTSPYRCLRGETSLPSQPPVSDTLPGPMIPQ